MDRSFLGRGWSFPPTFSIRVPGVLMIEEEADIASSLEVLLCTSQGERTMLPLYGCNLEELLFETLDVRTKTLVADKIETAILYHEPRIEVETIQVDDSQELAGVVFIKIVYIVKTTNSRFNFVYPYYKNEGTDINLATTFELIPDNQ